MSDTLPALSWDDGKYEFQRKLGNFVQYFQVNLPANSSGQPLQLIDPLIIAENMLNCETTDDVPEEVVDLAVLNVEFDQGMPLIEGLPIWERFEGETIDNYKLFKEYRESMYETGSRVVSKIAARHNLPGKFLHTIAKSYHWQMRCRSYDLHKKQEFARNKAFEIEKLATKHTKAADFLMEEALAYLEDHPEQLNPKVALEMLQVGMKAGRLALGLSGDKPVEGGSATHININQTSNSEGGSTVMETSVQAGQKQQDTSYLQSIVHILDQSGALDKAKQNIIEAEYTEVESDSNSGGAV